MSDEIKRVFDQFRTAESLKVSAVMERMAVENPAMSDEDLAELTWKALWDIEPVSPRDKDEFFQGQIDVIKKLRAYLAAKERT